MATQKCPDAGVQFFQCERFDQIVIGTHVQPADPVFERVTGGEDQHGERVFLLSDAGQEVQTVFIRQAQVQNNQTVMSGLQTLLGCTGG